MFHVLYKLSRKYRVFNKLLSMIYGCEIPFKTQIGKDVIFNHKALVVVLHPNSIIEDNVYIEHHVCLGQRTGNDNSAPVIKKNVVIGAYSIILGGVIIGEGSVIGAGSLVIDDIPPHSIYYNRREKIIKENDKLQGQY